MTAEVVGLDVRAGTGQGGTSIVSNSQYLSIESSRLTMGFSFDKRHPFQIGIIKTKISVVVFGVVGVGVGVVGVGGDGEGGTGNGSSDKGVLEHQLLEGTDDPVEDEKSGGRERIAKGVIGERINPPGFDVWTQAREDLDVVDSEVGH